MLGISGAPTIPSHVQAGLASDDDVTLNVTILTTVRPVIELSEA